LAAFTPRANLIARIVLAGGGAALLAGGGAWYAFFRSAYRTGVGLVRPQPVMFSHEHHAGALAIDCRYCHATVEREAFAGMPSAQTCMHCHSQLYTSSAMLAPVRRSWETGDPLAWNAVTPLPPFVQYDHSEHVQAGVSCRECHGSVRSMPLTARARPMTMEWCLSCHRAPERAVGSGPGDLYRSDMKPPGRGRPVEPVGLTRCSTCHY
jgi:hypothetical protein